MPAYDFHALCGGKITDFSGAVVDTKRNRLFIDGGGHGGYQGNEKYALDMVTTSTSIATCGGSTCTISSNPTVPTMTRLNDPSVPVGGKFGNTSATPPCAMTDGSRRRNIPGAVSYTCRGTTRYLNGLVRIPASFRQTTMFI